MTWLWLPKLAWKLWWHLDFTHQNSIEVERNAKHADGDWSCGSLQFIEICNLHWFFFNILSNFRRHGIVICVAQDAVVKDVVLWKKCLANVINFSSLLSSFCLKRNIELSPLHPRFVGWLCRPNVNEVVEFRISFFFLKALTGCGVRSKFTYSSMCVSCSLHPCRAEYMCLSHLSSLVSPSWASLVVSQVHVLCPVVFEV